MKNHLVKTSYVSPEGPMIFILIFVESFLDDIVSKPYWKLYKLAKHKIIKLLQKFNSHPPNLKLKMVGNALPPPPTYFFIFLLINKNR